MKFFKNSENVIASVILLSLLAWYVSFSLGLVLAYNDAMSYMNIARLVIDNQQTGLAQIGSVWPPLGHLLKLPFIWIDPLWHSGFAGSIVSMIAYVLTVIGVFYIAKEITDNRLAAGVSAIIAALNVNFLYLQSTPLTEPLFLALFTGSVLYLLKYIKAKETKYLLTVALLVSLQLLTRYDGWFVAAVFAIIIFVNELLVRKSTIKEAFGHITLYATPIAFAAVLWVGWNAAIFGNPLYFATGPFSAQAQQKEIEQHGGLATKGDADLSFLTYSYGALENIGAIILAASLLGWALLLFYPGVIKEKRLRFTAFIALASIVAFNVLALFLGFSTMNVPQLATGFSDGASEALFNVRYGILILPFVAVGAGLLAAKWRFMAPLVLILTIMQGAFLLYEQPVTVRDGRAGASAFVEHDISIQLSERVSKEEDVLISMSYFNHVAFASNLQLKDFVHEGVSKKWNSTLHKPEQSVDWIVMSNKDDRDPVYAHLVGVEKSDFIEDYKLVYSDKHAQLYQRKESLSAKN